MTPCTSLYHQIHIKIKGSFSIFNYELINSLKNRKSKNSQLLRPLHSYKAGVKFVQCLELQIFLFIFLSIAPVCNKGSQISFSSYILLTSAASFPAKSLPTSAFICLLVSPSLLILLQLRWVQDIAIFSMSSFSLFHFLSATWSRIWVSPTPVWDHFIYSRVWFMNTYWVSKSFVEMFQDSELKKSTNRTFAEQSEVWFLSGIGKFFTPSEVLWKFGLPCWCYL